jgi:hypothetical protein
MGRPGARAGAAWLALALPLTACLDDLCGAVEGEIGVVCAPDAALADAPLVLEVREACGTECARSPVCTAALAAGALHLTLTEDHCSVGTTACDAATCLRAVVPCPVPPLPAGDYPVVVSGGPAQVLRVRAGGQPSCRLPSP